MKIRISYTADETPTVERIATQLAVILPRHKVKKSAGTPPFMHLYFTPTNDRKSTK